MTHLEHAISAIEHAAWQAIHHHHGYDHTSTTTPEAPMSLLDDIRAEFHNAVAWGEDEFRSALPTVAKIADDAEAVAASAPVQAILGAVLSPADEAIIVGLVQRLDRAVHSAEGQPTPGDPQPLADAEPAGPQVAGVA